MGPLLATALLLQTTSILLLRLRLGKAWLRKPGTLLVLTSAVYIGLSPVLLSFGSIRALDVYRTGIQQSFVDEATLIMAVGMLAFTVGYLITSPERRNASAAPANIAAAVKAFDWRLLAVACAPLAAFTYEGRGYNGGSLTGAAAVPLATQLATEFLIILVVLAAFGFVLRYGVNWFLPVLIAQSVLLGAAGERTPVIIDAIVLIILLRHAGYRPSRSQVRIAIGLTLITILAITGVRAEQGRTLYTTNTGIGARVTALGTGVTAIGKPEAGQKDSSLVAQAAVRLDGVDFAGAILQAEHLGMPRLSAKYVPESLLLEIPSIAWKAKLAHGDALNISGLEADSFGLQQINFLPGFAGLYMGFLWWPLLITLLGGIGLTWGLAERCLLRSLTPTRLVILAAMIVAALSYEQGLPAMLLNLRTAAVIVGAMKLNGKLQARRLCNDQQPGPDGDYRPLTSRSPGIMETGAHQLPPS